jgi:putative iron-dependent peroxidase
MFIGRPEGNYDRILDVSRAVTGGLFFVPPPPMLESLGDDDEDGEDAGNTDDAADQSPPAGSGSRSTGSLNIGSLRGESQYE